MQVSKLEDLQAAFEAAGLATQFYAAVAAPLVDDAPWLPVGAYATDGSNKTFSYDVLVSNWQRAWAHCQAAGVTLWGHVGDGDRRFRKAVLRLMRNVPSGLDALRLAHKLVQLAAPKVCTFTVTECRPLLKLLSLPMSDINVRSQVQT